MVAFATPHACVRGAEPAASTLSLPLLLPPLRPPRPASVARLERPPIGLGVYTRSCAVSSQLRITGDEPAAKMHPKMQGLFSASPRPSSRLKKTAWLLTPRSMKAVC